jgi:hypothetical protein
MEILEVIVDVAGSAIQPIAGNDSSKKISKIGWIVMFLLIVALFIFTLLSS